MEPKQLLVVLALNSQVAALLRSSGKILWTTDLPGMMGDRFTTVTADETHVYACAKGQMHCLDLTTGRILWTNELKGFGYGIASLCLPGAPAAPDPAAYAKLEADKKSNTGDSSSNTM